MAETYTDNRRRKKKDPGRTILKWFLALTFVAIIALAVIWVIRYTDPRRKITGSWQTEADITAQVSEHASAYLKAAAMGGQVDVSQYMNDISISRILTFDGNGAYSISVDEKSYDRSSDKAYEQMADALKALIVLRFEAAGKNADPDTVESLMQEKTGMSVKEYLEQIGPDIMPALSDLEAEYNRNGIYTADRQVIILDNDRSVEYMVSNRMLALDPGAVDAESETTDPLAVSMMYTRVGSSAAASDEGKDDGEEKVTDVSCSSIPPESIDLFGDDIFSDLTAMSKVSAATSKNKMLENLNVHVEGGDARKVKSIHYEYANNRFVSMRDMALALKGSDAQFGISISGSEITISKGQSYNAVGGEDSLFDVMEVDWNEEPEAQIFSEEEAAEAEGDDTEVQAEDGDDTDEGEDDGMYEYVTDVLKFNKITVDGREVKYATLTGKNGAGNQDAFISITDLAMILDTDMSLEDGGLHVRPGTPFSVDIEGLKNAGFYNEVRSALVGDATTGEIYASFSDDVAVSIASTTKIMNLLCVMDAISSGEISRNDTVRTSLKAALLSETGDGVVPMKEGDEYSVEDLMYGMMLPSSNECALMLAEHIAGTESAYVERMNAKAAEIGLSDATVFYNCHGLPIYSDNIVTTKLQNQMSAADMFTLVSYLLAVYPQITDITSTTEYTIGPGETAINNLNPMLYNMPDAVGIKTGTTNMAGASLVAAVKAKDAAGSEHIIVSVEYGAENAVTRNTISELMLRYGINVMAGKNAGASGTGTGRTLPDGAEIPVTAEGLIRLLLAA